MKIFGLITLVALTLKYGETAICRIPATRNCECYSSTEESKLIYIDCNFKGKTKFSQLQLIADYNTSFIMDVFINNLNLKSLKEDLFKGINADTIAINNSAIESIDDSVFKGLENSLVDVEFTYTSLSSINVESFRKMKKLEGMKVSFSKLTKISKSDIDGLPSSLIDLYFSNNTIKEIEEGAFKSASTSYIELSHNELSKLPNCFSNITSTVDLGYNKFTEVPFEALENMQNASFVYLNNNQIKTINETEINYLINSGFYIDLSDNPLECGCDVKWLVGKKFIDYDYGVFGTCLDNNGRKGKDLSKLTADMFDDCKQN